MNAGLRCDEVERFIDAYVDGEFVEGERAELMQHLEGCPSCARKARFQGTFKAALKAAVPHDRASDALRARLSEQLAHAEGPAAGWQGLAWKAAPAAAAAVVLIALASSTSRSSRGVGTEAILSHSHNLPVEISGGREQVTAWLGRYVDFAVHPPQLADAALVGARLAQISNHQAAYLVYNIRGNRVSVFMFDPRDVALEAPRHRNIAGHQIYLVGERGFQVAMVRDQGVGYAFASDLGEDQMIQLVSSASWR